MESAEQEFIIILLMQEKEYLENMKAEYHFITEGFNNILNYKPEAKD